MKKHLLISAVALSASVGGVGGVDAMTYSYRLKGSNAVVADLAGEIMPNEPAIFSNWLLRLPADILRKKLAAVILNSPGGNVMAAAKISDAIANLPDHPNTGVMEGGSCYSACVLIWAAGARKSVPASGVIGVHQVDGLSAQDNARLSGILAQYLRSKGAPASVVRAEVTTPPASIYALTPADYIAWGVNIVGDSGPLATCDGVVGGC